MGFWRPLGFVKQAGGSSLYSSDPKELCSQKPRASLSGDWKKTLSSWGSKLEEEKVLPTFPSATGSAHLSVACWPRCSQKPRRETVKTAQQALFSCPFFLWCGNHENPAFPGTLNNYNCMLCGFWTRFNLQIELDLVILNAGKSAIGSWKWLKTSKFRIQRSVTRFWR